MPSHKTGRKLTRSHTTIIEKARDVVTMLERLPDVTKISLGIIKQSTANPLDVFKITRLDKLFEIHKDAPTAVATFG